MSKDPLSLLRESTIHNKSVTLLDASETIVTNISDAKSIKFSDDSVFPRDTPTNFKKSATSADSETYALDTLIFLVQNAQLDNSAYFKECRARQIEHVSIVDRRKILDYLTGKVNQLPNVTQLGSSGIYIGMLKKRIVLIKKLSADRKKSSRRRHINRDSQQKSKNSAA